MKTTQGAAPNHIMSTTQVPRPRIEPCSLELDYNVVACTRKQNLRLQDISKGSGLYFYPSQWQSGKITACHPNGLRFDSRTGHLGCGHYVVRSYTLSCFQFSSVQFILVY